jgi:hypothetical protein
MPQRRWRGLFVESNPKSNQAPSGATYSEDAAPDGASDALTRVATNMPALTGFERVNLFIYSKKMLTRTSGEVSI